MTSRKKGGTGTRGQCPLHFCFAIAIAACRWTEGRLYMDGTVLTLVERKVIVLFIRISELSNCFPWPYLNLKLNLLFTSYFCILCSNRTIRPLVFRNLVSTKIQANVFFHYHCTTWLLKRFACDRLSRIKLEFVVSEKCYNIVYSPLIVKLRACIKRVLFN